MKKCRGEKEPLIFEWEWMGIDSWTGMWVNKFKNPRKDNNAIENSTNRLNNLYKTATTEANVGLDTVDN